MSGKLPTKEVAEMRQSLLELVEAANRMTVLNEKVEILRKGFKAFGVDTDEIKTKYGGLDEMLATSDGADKALKILKKVQNAFKETGEFSEIVG